MAKNNFYLGNNSPPELLQGIHQIPIFFLPNFATFSMFDFRFGEKQGEIVKNIPIDLTTHSFKSKYTWCSIPDNEQVHIMYAKEVYDMLSHVNRKKTLKL